ncbi:MAG: carboxymuconolactone decarboxylase family protein [Sphingobacteriaceae bacterium]|jgi:AhpD family alkylhydroperoxidase|nr:carboxymuconolactone decarboxylase family protein [Sphingobacteriaceae bacterium]
MEQRVNIEKTLPEAYKTMISLSGVVGKAGLSAIQKHLIKVRVSQINSCAYCINMHTLEALKAGETQQRLFVLSAWRETDLFTAEEKALLALAEEVTLIHAQGISDNVYREASQFFSEERIAEIIMSAIVMSSWNRIAISGHMPIG